MAEGAKILNPSRKVLLPDLRAGCSLSDSCPPEAFAPLRAQASRSFCRQLHQLLGRDQSSERCHRHELKRGQDRRARSRRIAPILFAPDRNLGAYVAKQTGREMLLWQGTCIVHETFSRTKDRRASDPTPRCRAHRSSRVRAFASCARREFIGSTSALLKLRDRKLQARIHRGDRRRNPASDEQEGAGKDLHPRAAQSRVHCNECPFMKLNTLEKVYLALRDETPEITSPPIWPRGRFGASGAHARVVALNFRYGNDAFWARISKNCCRNFDAVSAPHSARATGQTASTVEPIDIVFDLDDTLIRWVRENESREGISFRQKEPSRLSLPRAGWRCRDASVAFGDSRGPDQYLQLGSAGTKSSRAQGIQASKRSQRSEFTHQIVGRERATKTRALDDFGYVEEVLKKDLREINPKVEPRSSWKIIGIRPWKARKGTFFGLETNRRGSRRHRWTPSQ